MQVNAESRLRAAGAGGVGGRRPRLDEGRGDLPSAGHPAQVPREHPARAETRRDRALATRRGGGYRLGHPANEITLADVIRVVDGPLANVRGLRPERLEYIGPATSLLQVWIALRANMRAVLERVTLEDLVTGNLPPEVVELTEAPDAWSRR